MLAKLFFITFSCLTFGLSICAILLGAFHSMNGEPSFAIMTLAFGLVGIVSSIQMLDREVL